LVTEQASPALLAVALPRLLAGPVLAGGIFRALVAEGTLPALSAAENDKEAEGFD